MNGSELLIALFGGGSVAAILGVLTAASLRVQKQQGEQIAEWKVIIAEKDKQIVSKDSQITRLESIIAIRDERISRLENRVTELERKVPHE